GWVVLALDCGDREAMCFLATTGGIAGEDVRDLMVAAVEYRVNRLPVTIEWLSDNVLCRRRHPQLRPRHRARTEDDASRKSTEQRNGSEYFSKLVLKLIRRAECPKYCLLTAPARYVHQNAVK